MNQKGFKKLSALKMMLSSRPVLIWSTGSSLSRALKADVIASVDDFSLSLPILIEFRALINHFKLSSAFTLKLWRMMAETTPNKQTFWSTFTFMMSGRGTEANSDGKMAANGLRDKNFETGIPHILEFRNYHALQESAVDDLASWTHRMLKASISICILG